MSVRLFSCITTVALIATLGTAAAATGANMKSANDALNLTRTQRHDIYSDVSKQNVGEAKPSGFTARLGETLPSSLLINPLPASAIKQVPAVKSYDFAMVGKDVLLVSPGSKEIADIITR